MAKQRTKKAWAMHNPSTGEILLDTITPRKDECIIAGDYTVGCTGQFKATKVKLVVIKSDKHNSTYHCWDCGEQPPHHGPRCEAKRKGK